MNMYIISITPNVSGIYAVYKKDILQDTEKQEKLDNILIENKYEKSNSNSSSVPVFF